jgi:DNA repair exonuclease SbcCD ATPase subunit
MIPRSIRLKQIGPFEDVDFSFDSVGGDVVAIVGRNGCLVGDTMIDVPRNLTLHPHGIPIKELVGTRPLVYSHDRESRKTILNHASQVWSTGIKDVFRVRFTRPKGRFAPPAELIGTKEHLIMLIDGTWRPLGELRPGDRIMPLTRRIRDGKYAAIVHQDRNLEGEHRMVAAFTSGSPLLDNEDPHHIDLDPLNNDPLNIARMLSVDHGALHGRLRPPHYEIHPRGMLGKRHSEDVKAAISAGSRASHSDPAIKAAHKLGLRKYWDAQDQPWANKELLTQMYCIERLSTVQIADALGVSDHTIGYWLEWFSIPRRSLSESIRIRGQENYWHKQDRPWAEKSQLEQMYLTDRLSAPQIASRFGCTDTCVRNWLRRFGLPIRDRQDSHTVQQFNHKVISIDECGQEETFDMEVPGSHNFIANGVVVSNSGKTMFVESMFASFYRYFPYREASIYKYCRGKDAKISFAFDQGTDHYLSVLQINAEKRSMKVYLYKDGKPIGGEDGNTGPFDEIMQTLFGSSKMVLASSFGSQNKRGSFIELEKADRKALFISMLGLNRLQKISDLAGKHADASQFEMQRLTGQHEMLQVTASKMVPDVETLHNSRDNLRQEVIHAEADYKDVQSIYSALKNKAAILPVITQQMNLLSSRSAKLKTDIATERKVLSDAELIVSQLPMLGDLIAFSEGEIIATKEQIASLANKMAVANAAKNTLLSLKHRHKRLDEDIVTSEDLIVKLKEMADSAPKLRDMAQGLEEGRRNIQALRGELARSQQELATYQRMIKEYAEQTLMIEKTRAESEKIRAVNTITLQRAQRDSLIINVVPCHGEGEYVSCQFLANAIKGRDSIDEISGDIDVAQSRMLACDQQMKQLRRPDPQGQHVIESEIRKTTLAISELERRVAMMERDRDALAKAEAAETKIGEVKQALAGFQMDLSLVNVDIENISFAVAEGEETAKERNKQEAELKKMADSLHGLTVRKVAAEVAEGQMGQIKNRIMNWEADSALVANSLEKTSQEFRSAKAAEDEARRAQISMQEAENHLENRRTNLEVAQNELTRAETILNEILEAHKKSQEIRPHLQKTFQDHRNWNFLAKAFGKMEIQSLEIAAAGPAVSDIANKELLYSCFGPRFSIKFVTQRPTATGGVTDDFDLYVYDAEKNREGSVDDLSGGERTIVSEAAALATALYNRQKSNVGWASIWRDEVSGALDDENAIRYITMLRRARQVGHFSKLFFIAHQSRVVDLADSQIRIEDGCVTVG